MKKNKQLSLHQKIELFLFRLYRSNEIKHHELTYLFWETTLRCNLSCLHCGSDCKKNNAIPDMPISDFLIVLDSIKKRIDPSKVFICITGGEPLLRKDLAEAGKEITKRGFSWGIVTNGILLDNTRLQNLIKAGIKSVSISIDGEEAEHNWLRQHNKAFALSIQAVKLCASVYKQNKTTFGFDVITCVNKRNVNKLSSIRTLLETNNVPSWRLFGIFPSGRAKNNGELALSTDERKRMMDFIVQTRKTSVIHTDYSCEGFLGSYEKKVRDFYFFCRSGVSTASIMCDGAITGCLSVRAKDFIQGSIYENDFMDVWEQGFTSMRNRSWSKKGKCASCVHWKNCLGGPIHLHTDAHSEPELCTLL